MKPKFLIITLLFSYSLFGQNIKSKDTVSMDVHKVFALYERTDIGVNLRWAPSTPKLWLQGIYNGYNIFRIEYDSLADLDKAKMKLLKTVKPKAKQAWLSEMKSMQEIPKYLAGAYECTFGEFKSLKLNKGMAGWLDQADELKNKFSFALYIADIDQQAAEYSGLFYKDKTALKSKEYLYLIEPILDHEKSDFIYSPGVTIAKKEVTKYLPIELDLQELDNNIKLFWSRNVEKNKRYTAFYIEKSINGSRFKQIKDVPYIHGLSENSYSPLNIYIDSVKNYQPVKYKIRGITPFGKLGPYSNIVSGEGKDLTAPSPPNMIETNLLEEGEMLISWNGSNANDLAGYHVYKGSSPNNINVKLNKKLLAKTTLKFIDTTVNSILDNYYVIAAEDKKGNVSRSVPEFAMIFDSIPPSKPIGLEGKIDTTGTLTLKWKKNKELDMRGYKVYFANDNSHEYALLTGQAIKDTVFKTKITLNTLTEEAWFKVMAVDKRYNYSLLSDPLKIMRPDTIPPNSPIFKNYKVNKKDIYLQWANSSSKDVVKHQLWRKQGKISTWLLISDFIKNETEYTDNQIENGKQYIYKIIAIDDANLTSPVANKLYLDTPKIYLKNIIESFNVSLSTDKKPILTWRLKSTNGGKIIIYRNINNKGFYPIKTIDITQNKFSDNLIINNNSLVDYSIRVKLDNGTYSPYSEVIKINKKQ